MVRLTMLAVGVALSSTPGAWAQATGPLNTIGLPRGSTNTVVVREAIPDWVALPPTARILTSGDLTLRPLRNSAVTHENTRVGVLVGALTNVGRCARDLRVRLQYTDDRWRPLGDPIESEARVSDVSPDGVLPYRFRLKRKDDFPEPPSGYLLQVSEGDAPVAGTLEWVSGGARPVDRTACPASSLVVTTEVTRSRATLRGYRVSGRLTVVSGGPVRPDGITLTALLRDADGDVLEVLTGVPDVEALASSGLIQDGQSLAFAMSTDVPLGKGVATTTVFAEVLPDAHVGAGR